MIISRTPLRISLFGGGTDLPAFYCKYGGAVISMAIDKYVYVSVNPKFDGRTRVSYSKTETVSDPKDLEHDLVRETLNLYNERGLEITSISDIPGSGTGLGSSSAFTVGLLSCISGMKRHGTPWPASMLAETAYSIEANLCGHPVGKQDQYAAAYGNFNFYEFQQGGNISVQPIVLRKEEREYIQNHMMLFWTGQTRSANDILQEQKEHFSAHNERVIESGNRLREIAIRAHAEFRSGSFINMGHFLDQNWQEKKNLASGVSNDGIDYLYRRAIKAGATGGKLCGAGGGGFLLFFVEPHKQGNVIQELNLPVVKFNLEKEGSKVIYYDR